MPDRSGFIPAASAEELLQELRLEGIRDTRVLLAFRRVPREGFVPRESAAIAYVDRPIPIPHGQVTTQPSLIAKMVEALQLGGQERVLEVGTGLGFQAGILARLAKEVYSIDRFADLVERAKANLAEAGITGVTLAVGDGTLGLPEHAPFDAIVVSAASPEVPAPLVDQLAEAGRIVHPVGTGGNEDVVLFRKEKGHLVRERSVVPAHFVRLIGEYGLSEEPTD
jgi:protein-L-isoaspartate(D-aspartate) O-methyltransferase